MEIVTVSLKIPLEQGEITATRISYKPDRPNPAGEEIYLMLKAPIAYLYWLKRAAAELVEYCNLSTHIVFLNEVFDLPKDFFVNSKENKPVDYIKACASTVQYISEQYSLEHNGQKPRIIGISSSVLANIFLQNNDCTDFIALNPRFTISEAANSAVSKQLRLNDYRWMKENFSKLKVKEVGFDKTILDKLEEIIRNIEKKLLEQVVIANKNKLSTSKILKVSELNEATLEELKRLDAEILELFGKFDATIKGLVAKRIENLDKEINRIIAKAALNYFNTSKVPLLEQDKIRFNEYCQEFRKRNVNWFLNPLDGFLGFNGYTLTREELLEKLEVFIYDWISFNPQVQNKIFSDFNKMCKDLQEQGRKSPIPRVVKGLSLVLGAEDLKIAPPYGAVYAKENGLEFLSFLKKTQEILKLLTDEGYKEISLEIEELKIAELKIVELLNPNKIGSAQEIEQEITKIYLILEILSGVAISFENKFKGYKPWQEWKHRLKQILEYDLILDLKNLEKGPILYFSFDKIQGRAFKTKAAKKNQGHLSFQSQLKTALKYLIERPDLVPPDPVPAKEKDDISFFPPKSTKVSTTEQPDEFKFSDEKQFDTSGLSEGQPPQNKLG